MPNCFKFRPERCLETCIVLLFCCSVALGLSLCCPSVALELSLGCPCVVLEFRPFVVIVLMLPM